MNKTFSKSFYKKKIVAIIPARSGSKGLKDKNIKLLGKHPLIAWSIAVCKKIKLIDYVLVSTNSKKYSRIAKKYRAEVPFLRPQKISGSFSTDYEIIDHALKELIRLDINPEIIVHIRPTTPLRDYKIMSKAIKFFIRKKNTISALRSVNEMSETAYKAFQISKSKTLQPLFGKINFLDKLNLPRQNFKKTYVANGIIDIYSVDFIKKNKMLLGSKVFPFITESATEIDNINDFKYLEHQVKRNKKFFNNFFK